MIGVLLAGGRGTRLGLLTAVTNKHLLPIYDRLMIHYPIQLLKSFGITNIALVTGREHGGAFIDLLGSGEEHGVQINYAMQEGPGGIADALGKCKQYAGGGPVVVMLADNLFFDDLSRPLHEFRIDPTGAMVFLKQVDDPRSFGVATVEAGRITAIIEKPTDPVSDLAVTGLYCYDERVWGIIKTLKPSGRGELEITDVNNWYVQANAMRHHILTDFWGDCGESIDGLHQVAVEVAKRRAATP